MDEATEGMYKKPMESSARAYQLIVRDYETRHSPPAPQVLMCCYCILRRWEHDDMSAPFWRWYSNDRAGASLSVDGKTVSLKPGNIYLVPPHTACASHTAAEVGHLHVHFVLGVERAAQGGPVFEFEARPDDRRMTAELLALLRRREVGAELGVGFLSHALINRALSRIPAEYWRGRGEDERLERVLRCLRTGISGGVDNAFLARQAGLSLNAFVRYFREAVGDTPHRYLMRLRVEQACGLLREGRASLDEIAAASGFCDRFHLSRVFKRQMGAGPAEYRRRSEAAEAAFDA